MCGSENRLFKAKVEGTVLNVCKHCAKYGEVIGKVHDKQWIEKFERKREKARKKISDKPLTEGIVDDYSEVIKKKREEKGLKQEDFARMINEKASLIHKIETGNFEPSIKLARKIEKFLRITLVEQREGSGEVPLKTESESFTLGDFIKVR